MHIERINDYQSYDIPVQCTPDDWIIVINSSILGLRFESNMLPDTSYKVIHIADDNQYFICHERIRFKLTVSGYNLKSEDIDIFNLNETYAFNITSNIQRGTVNVRTSPPNTNIFFPVLNQIHSSERPITQNTGPYQITIRKDRFKNLDTLITFRRDTSNYFFSLNPLFAQIQLNLTTEDSVAFARAPKMVIHDLGNNTDYNIDLNYLINPETSTPPDYFHGVRYFQLYENNIIPIPEGQYRISIEAENYKPFETVLFAEKEVITYLPVTLNLIHGYITFIDSLNARGAKIIINDQFAGNTVPHFKARVKIGTNTVKFEKPGYKTQNKEYFINVAEEINSTFYVAMKPWQQLTIKSEPPSALIYFEGTMMGMTPLTYEFPVGNYNLILKMPRYSSHLHRLTESPDFKLIDTLQFVLHENHPLKVKSEGKQLELQLKGVDYLENIIIENPVLIKDRETQELRLPYGRYLVETNINDYLTYKGIYYHHSQKRLRTIPSYSKSSFTFLTADYVNDKNMEASFGRITIFPKTGLSTSIINAQYLVLDVFGDYGSGGLIDKGDTFNEYEVIVLHPIFLNWDWRLGGSIIRQLDICLLGRAKWTPGIKMAGNINLFDFHDANLLTYFYGMEITTRLPVLNLNLKIGQQVLNGEIHVWDKNHLEYLTLANPPKVSEKDFIISLGATINFTGVSRSNNMLRLWRKPLVHRVLDMLVN